MFMEIQLLYELLGGALTGYFTNSLAVKMLFKKYGPFGGVILKTRDDFINNISLLVERDLINTHTLEKELHKKEVRLILNKMVADFVSTHLPQQTSNLTLNNLSGSRDSYDNLLAFYQTNLVQTTEKFVYFLLSEIKFDNLLSSKQLEFLSEAGLRHLKLFLKQEENLKTCLLELYHENNQKQLDELLPITTLKKIANNLKPDQEEINTILLNNEEELTNLLYELYDQLNIRQTLIKLETRIKQDLYKITTVNEKGKLENLLINLLRVWFSSLKKCNRPLKDILGGQFFTKFEKQLGSIMANILSDLLILLNKNSTEIEKLLDKCMERAFRSESTSFNLKVGLKRILYNSFKRKSSLGGDSQGFLNIFNYKIDITKVAKNISASIVSIIETKTPGDVINYLEDNRLLNEEVITSLVQNIIPGKSKILEEINLVNLVEGSLKINLIKFIKEKYLLDPEFLKSKLLHSNIENEESFFSTSINKLFSEERLHHLSVSIINSLDHNKEKLTEWLTATLQKEISDTKIPEKIINFITTRCNTSMITFLEENKDRLLANRIEVFIKHLKQEQRSSQEITDKLIGFLDDNLHLLLEGQISETIAANLDRVPDQDMQKLIEDFMGNELKPITSFGAILGFFAGGLLYLMESKLTLPFNYSLFLSTGIYGLIGYLTNIIAIKMVFRPYQEKKIMGLRLPFTPGIVTREKNRFASALGQFIDKELLNNEKLITLFKEKRQLIEEKAISYIIKDNYQIIKKIILLNRKNSSKTLSKLFLNNTDKMTEKIIKKISTPLAKDQSLLPENTAIFFPDQEKIKKKIINSLINLKKEGKTLGSILPVTTEENPGLQHFSEKIIDKWIEIIINQLNDLKETNDFLPVFDSLRTDSLVTKLKEPEIIDILAAIVLSFLPQDKGENFTHKVFGKVPETILSNLPEQVTTLIKQERENIKSSFREMIKKEWGIWYSASKILDLEYSLNRFIDEILDYGLPRIPEILDNDLEKLITDSLPDIIRNFYKHINPDLHYILKNTLQILLTEGNIEETLKIIRKAIPPEIKQEYVHFIIWELTTNLETKKDNISGSIETFITPIINKTIMKKDISELLKGITKEDLTLVVDKITALSKEGTAVKKEITLLIKYFNIVLQEKGPGALLNLNYLENDLQTIGSRCKNNQEFNRALEQFLRIFLKKIASNLEQIIQPNTLETCLKIFFNSLIDSLENNFLEVLKQIDIARVTEDEVSQMKAEEIEDLFYSFAGSYLTNLERYGWIGSIIGLLNGLLQLR